MIISEPQLQATRGSRHAQENQQSRGHTYCNTSQTSRKCASAALVGGASGPSGLIWGSGPSLSQTAKNSRSFLLRDVTIPLWPSAHQDRHETMRRRTRFPADAKGQLTYLSWARLDRKSAARSAAPTSLILGRTATSVWGEKGSGIEVKGETGDDMRGERRWKRGSWWWC